jgi:H+-transporting ATPase
MGGTDFSKLSVEETFKTLESGEGGLANENARARISKYGYNEILEKKKSKLLALLMYFWGPLPWMIEAAAILSAVLQNWDDLAIIIMLLLANALIGFWQENKADNAVELLKKRLAITAKVLRDGAWTIVPSRLLVPGDVIRIRLGDIVPADVKLFRGDYLTLDESALTGESLPVEKRGADTTFSGAVAKQGEMDAVVTATGQNTFFGKTTKLVQGARSENHLQKAVVKIGDYLIIMAIVLVTVVVIAGILRGEDILSNIQFALILLVASVPVALPAVLSVTMAVGAVELANKEAVVTKLETIEEIAGMDVLCVDKTGTITKNEISISDVRGYGGFSRDDVVGLASVASRKEDNDPIEKAIFEKMRGGRAWTPERYKVIKYRPFDPEIKRTEATCTDAYSGGTIVITKGAPQVILGLLQNSGTVSVDANDAVDEFAGKGFRTLAVAEGSSISTLRLVGLIALYDPPREDAKETIGIARSMYVDVKMVTGDHVAIAKEMCSEVGIGTNIMQAKELEDPATGAAEIEKANAFAEVFPEHKYKIVNLLQKQGHIAGMTGDGVNDAPALKEANVGIAVSGATDAARSAADIVLTASGISVIIDAIKQGRMIFERMNSYAIYRIAETVRVLFFLSLSILVFNIYPLTVLMLVLLALINDFPIMMIAYDNVRAHDKPVRWDMRYVFRLSTLLGAVGLVSSFGMLLLGMYVFKLDFQTLQALIFLKMAVAGHLTIYLARTGKKHFWARPFPSGRLFYTAEITKVLATVMVVYGILLPVLPLNLALFVWVYSLGFMVITDYIKVAALKYWDREPVVKAATVAAAA